MFKCLFSSESFTLDADLMGLDFTLTDDLQPPTTVASFGEGLPVSAVAADTNNSKTADAIADILGLATNPYLSGKDNDENKQLFIGDNETGLTATEIVSTTNESLPTTNTSISLPSQSFNHLVVSKEELQSIMPSQETLDALRVPHSTLQSLAVESDGKPIPDHNSQQMSALSSVVRELLSSLPDVTFMLSNTHTQTHMIQQN